MSMVRRIETTKRENLLLRTQRARQGLPPIAAIPKPRGSSLAKELDYLEREQTALKVGLKPRASTATQAAPTEPAKARPRGHRTCDEKRERARRPQPQNEFTYLKNGCVVADPEAAQACARRLAIERTGGVENQRREDQR